MERLKERLKDADIIPSRYRVDVLNYLDTFKNHPTTDMIFNYLKKKYPHISLATVYNSLNSFIEAGIIISLKTADNKIHYDSNLKKHYHFICEKCSEIYDILNNNDPVGISPAEVDGHVVREVVTYFYGTCAECINKIDRDKAVYQEAKDHSVTIHIRGMENKFSVNSIKNAIEKVKGVKKVKVSLKNGSASITGDFDLNRVNKEIGKIGYQAID